MERNEYKIFACFAKAKDESHILKNRVHLVGSAVVSRFLVDKEDVIERFKGKRKSSGGYNFVIFNVMEEDRIEEQESGVIINDDVTYYDIQFKVLIRWLDDTYGNGLADKFFGNDLMKEGFDGLNSSECLFVFTNELWSNIVLKFKLNGIDVSGGCISDRHMLSTGGGALKDFLNIIYEYNLKLINQKIIYDSRNNEHEIMSGKIPLKFYKKADEIICSYKSGKFGVEEMLLKLVKIDERLVQGMRKDMLIKFVMDNLNLIKRLLIDSIIKKYEDALIPLRNKLKINKDEKESNDYRLNEINKVLTGDIKTREMSNKSKKKYKKYRKELEGNIKNEKKNINVALEWKVQNLSGQIEEIEEEISKIEERKTEIEKSLDVMNFKEINDKYFEECVMEKTKEKKNKLIWKNNKYSKKVINKQLNGNLLGKRSYSSVSRNVLVEDNSNYTHPTVELSVENLHLKKGTVFGVELKKIVDKIKTVSCESEIDKEEEEKKIQIEIESFCLENEEKIVDNLIENVDRYNEFDPVVAKMSLHWTEIIVKSLENFIQPYIINNYEKLMVEMKKNSGNADLFLLILAMLYAVKSKNLNVDVKLGKEKELLYFNEKTRKVINKEKKEYKLLCDRFEKYKKNEWSSLVSIIITVLIGLIQYDNNNNDDDNYSGYNSQQFIVNKLGEEILKRAPKEIPELFLKSNDNWSGKDRKFIIDYYNENINLYDSLETINIIGNSLLELILDNVNIIERSRTFLKNGRRTKYIYINQEYVKLFRRCLFYPNKLPMVVEPKAWSTDNNGNEDGGYLLYRYKRLVNGTLIHNNKKNLMNSIVTDNQRKTNDYLNKQKFLINKSVLRLLTNDFNKENSFFFEDKNKIHPLSEKWGELDSVTKKIVSSHNSKFNLYSYVLSLAIIYREVYYYLPTYMDFRGRIYTFVDYLNYQGGDLSRSLIEFAKGCKIDKDNIVYVLQHLANTAGKSRLTVKNKNKWAINFINELKILPHKLDLDNLDLNFDRENNDFEIEDLLNKSEIKEIISVIKDEKIQFLTTLFSLIRSLLYSDEFRTPICFDATCSGFQHLSALFKDIEMGAASNVLGFSIDTEDLKELKKKDTNHLNEYLKDIEIQEEVGDVYSEVANTVLDRIDKIEDLTFKDKLLKMNIDRKILKGPTMTVPYNVGLDTMSKQILNDGFFTRKYDSLDKDKNVKTYFYIISPKTLKDEYKGETIILTAKEMGIFNGILYTSIYKTFPSLRDYVNYLNKFAGIFSKNNWPISWKTPAGMRINMAYASLKNKDGKNLYNKRRGASVTLPINGQLDRVSNKIAFMPNFIHSMDSAHIQLLVMNLIAENRNINLFTIHDCFATTPDTMRYLNAEIRRAFAMLYFDQDYIKVMHNDFISQISDYTQIYKENLAEEIVPYDMKTSLNEDENLFICKENEKIFLPKITHKVDWKLVKGIFEEGIKKSLNFVN